MMINQFHFLAFFSVHLLIVCFCYYQRTSNITTSFVTLHYLLLIPMVFSLMISTSEKDGECLYIEMQKTSCCCFFLTK